MTTICFCLLVCFQTKESTRPSKNKSGFTYMLQYFKGVTITMRVFGVIHKLVKCTTGKYHIIYLDFKNAKQQ